jgi:hypothetical protein
MAVMSFVIEAMGRAASSLRENNVVLLLRSCTSTTFERTALIEPAAAPAAATPAVVRARVDFEGLALEDFKALVLDFVEGLLAASATERLPWGVPDGATTFLVVFELLVFFLALVLLAVVAAGFLTALSADDAVCASSGEPAKTKLRLTKYCSQDFLQDKLNFKNILSALQSIKTMQIIYLALILKLVFYPDTLNFY